MQQWFEQINLFLHSHPHWIGHLGLLLRIKVALLAVLMGYFLYRIYSEQKKTADSRRSSRDYRFIA